MEYELRITNEKDAQLNWAFSIIFEFMKDNGLDELKSKLVPLRVNKD